MRILRGKFLFFLMIASAALLPAAQAPTATRRQPAPVMGVGGADWLIRPERIQEEEPDRMLAALDIKKGSVVADIGAGVGYHVWRLAEIVGPAGKVIGEDIQEGMIALMKKNVEARKLRNVEIVLGTPVDPRLPRASIDLVLMVDVYHEFAEPVTMMRQIQQALKPNGRVALVEFRKEDPNVPIQPLHKMSVQDVRSELEPLGFRFERSLEFLPWQHILIFSTNKRRHRIELQGRSMTAHDPSKSLRVLILRRICDEFDVGEFRGVVRTGSVDRLLLPAR